jgi:hypothetical protein
MGPVSDLPQPPADYRWTWWDRFRCRIGLGHYYVQQADHPMHHVCACCGDDVVDWVW